MCLGSPGWFSRSTLGKMAVQDKIKYYIALVKMSMSTYRHEAVATGEVFYRNTGELEVVNRDDQRRVEDCILILKNSTIGLMGNRQFQFLLAYQLTCPPQLSAQMITGLFGSHFSKKAQTVDAMSGAFLPLTLSSQMQRMFLNSSVAHGQTAYVWW